MCKFHYTLCYIINTKSSFVVFELRLKSMLKYFDNENFEKAYNIIKQPQPHPVLIHMLETGNIPERQAAALKLENLTSKREAEALLSNLTGQDGKIREAVSAKIKEFSYDNSLRLLFNPCANVGKFLDAIVDINGNICRNIICAVKNFKNDKEFCNLFINELVKRTFDLANQVKDFKFEEGKYKINKEVFKLYWYLETIYEFFNLIKDEDLIKIIAITKNIEEYTIREKSAKILTNNLKNDKLKEFKKELQGDKNYYVRRYK